MSNFRLSIFLIYMLVTSASTAQQDYSFLEESNVWVMKGDSNEGSLNSTTSLQFISDTIIEGKSCKVMSDVYSNLAILCELDNKLFGKQMDYGTELQLIYDFDLLENDTFIYRYFYSGTQEYLEGKMEVLTVDSITLLNGEVRKRIKLEYVGNAPNLCHFPATWIDGVGDINNYYLYLFFECFEANYFLHCFYSDTTLLMGDCGPNSIKENLIMDLEIYPNPFCGEISVNSNYEISTLEIFDFKGNKQSDLILNGNSVFGLGELNAGVYFVKVIFQDDSIVFRKLVKDNCH